MNCRRDVFYGKIIRRNATKHITRFVYFSKLCLKMKHFAVLKRFILIEAIVILHEKGCLSMKTKGKKLRKTACTLTAGMMILSAGTVFTGCRNNSGDSRSENNVNNGVAASEEESVRSLAYTVNDIEPDADNFYHLTSKNGLLYSTIYESEQHGDTWYSRQYILVMDETGKTQVKIPVFEQTEDYQFGTIYGDPIVDDDGNITCIFQSGTYDPQTYTQDGKYQILTFGPEGDLISSKDIEDIYTREENNNGKYLNGLVTDSEGNIYCNLSTCVRVLDSTGKVLFTTDEIDTNNGYMQSIILTNSGVPAVGIQQWGEKPVSKLVEIDLAAQNFGTEYILPDEYINSMYSGSGDYLCYFPNDTGVTGVRADTLEKESVLNLVNLGVDTTQLDLFTVCGDGSFITGGWTYSGTMSKMAYSHIKPIDSSEVKEKQIVTLGCFSMDQFWRSAVAYFNRTNSEYTISAVSYSDSNDTYDYEAAIKNFNNEIISGNMPDILLMDSSMTFDSYKEKGLFTDLYTLIDNDPDLSRDSFLPNILAAMKTDDKLYSMTTSFSVSTYAAKASRVGMADHLTPDEADRILSELPEGASLTNDAMDQNSYLSEALFYNSFVDYENGTCNYDSPEFKAILETAKTYPAEIDYSMIDYDERTLAVKNDTALLYGTYLYDFDSYSQLKDGLIGEDTAFVGFPNNDGANGSLNIATMIAVAEKSQLKEGAWEFIKCTLDNLVTEYEQEIYNPYAESGAEPVTEMRWGMNRLHWGFPVMTEDLEHLGMQSTIPMKTFNEDGEMIPQEHSYSINSIEIKLQPLTEEDAREFIDYLTSVDTVKKYDSNLNSIIQEEVSGFFGGAKSADETAQIIQSRVSIYLSEQYGS